MDKDRFRVGYEIFTFKAKFVIIFEVFTTHYIERLKENIKFFFHMEGAGVVNLHPKTVVPILSSVLRRLSSN